MVLILVSYQIQAWASRQSLTLRGNAPPRFCFLGADYCLGNKNCPPDIHGVLEVSVGDGAGGLREGHGDGIPVDPSPSAVVVVGRGFDRGQGEDVLDVPLSSRPDQGCAAVAALVDNGKEGMVQEDPPGLVPGVRRRGRPQGPFSERRGWQVARTIEAFLQARHRRQVNRLALPAQGGRVTADAASASGLLDFW